MPAPNADWTIRAEKKMKDSVRAKLLQSDTASSFFKIMTRNERVLMYTQYNLTGNKDMIKIKPLHAMNEKDIDLAASNFASWLIIQTKIYPSSGQEISAEKNFFIKWLAEQRDASSSCQCPDEQHSALVELKH